LLYADLPHALIHGWPGWITRTPAQATNDLPAQATNDLVTAMWDRSLAATGIAPQQMVPTVREIDAPAYARKLTAIREYVTQVGALTEYLARPLSDRETFGYEVVWRLPSAAGTAKPQATGDASQAP
jgi:hypothetical protein